MGAINLSRRRSRDVPAVGVLVLGALGALAMCVAFALYKPRLAGLAAWIPFILVSGLAELQARHIGRWGEVKRTLKSLEDTAAKYESEHGPIDTQEEASRFNRAYAQRFSFAPDGPKVLLVYRWWWRRPCTSTSASDPSLGPASPW